MKRIGFICAMLVAAGMYAQVTPVYQMEKLSRGLMAMPAQGEGIIVSWRLLGTDDVLTTTFDVIRDGRVIAEGIGDRTNFVDSTGTPDSRYQVETYVDGMKVETSTEVTPWTDTYKVIQLNRPADGLDGVTGESYSYTPNDCSAGDVDGDGEYELIVQWQPSNKTSNGGNLRKHPGNEYIDCYRFSGEHLWRIDMGQNLIAGDHRTQFMVYDFDGNGKAEVIMKTAPGTIDGKGRYVNLVADDEEILAADNTKDWRSPEYACMQGGQEYLTVFSGETGEALHTIFYNPNRDAGYGGEATGFEFNWDDRPGKSDYAATYGHRGNCYLATVAYLDGMDKLPSVVMCRGYYTYSFLWAVDFRDGKLVHKWLHASISKTEVELTNAQWEKEIRTYATNTFNDERGCNTAYGQGNHNISVADVDSDGCDEIIYGGATIDNDGWLLYSTGMCHGDAMDVADIIPSRPGYEVYRCLECEPYGVVMYDARTGEKIYYAPAYKDTGRALAADISADYEGLEFWGSTGNYPRESASGNFEMFYDAAPSVNFRIYWDGDLQDELFDGSLDTETGVAHPNILKWDGTTFVEIPVEYNGSQTCNWTKATPCLQADVMGDWREELLMWNLDDPSQMNIIASNIPSEYRVPTLMHDHIYRLGIAWQNVAYNQPPHLGYYLPNADFRAKGGDNALTEVMGGAMPSDLYYDLYGRLLQGKPTRAGIYIYGGAKVLIE